MLSIFFNDGILVVQKLKTHFLLVLVEELHVFLLVLFRVPGLVVPVIMISQGRVNTLLGTEFLKILNEGNNFS